MNKKKIIYIPLASAAILIMVGVFTSNSIISLEENTHAKWSQLLNQYKRRVDLVEQLVQVVQGSANFEKELLESVLETRRQIQSINTNITPSKTTEHQLSSTGKSIKDIINQYKIYIEQYPHIKSTEAFLTLQSQLEGNENRISVAKNDYIEAIREFNIAITTFPGGLLNALFLNKNKKQQYQEELDISKNISLRF